jgi:hypothetical protein
MITCVLTTALILLAPAIAIAQRVCKQPPDDAILTICERESGMAPLPQPQLVLRVYRDGRAEYETLGGGDGLNLKKIKITDKELNDMLALGRAADFQNAKDAYPAFEHRDDSSSLITVTFKDEGKQKRRTLANFYVGNPENKLHYPKSLIALMKLAMDIREKAMGVVHPIPTISFCELIRNHDQYLGEKVSIYAKLEYHASITADLRVTSEEATLNDPNCDSASMGDQRTTTWIGVGYGGTEAEIEVLKNKVRGLSDHRFNGRARVLATGILVDERQRS